MVAAGPADIVAEDAFGGVARKTSRGESRRAIHHRDAQYGQPGGAQGFSGSSLHGGDIAVARRVDENDVRPLDHAGDLHRTGRVHMDPVEREAALGRGVGEQAELGVEYEGGAENGELGLVGRCLCLRGEDPAGDEKSGQEHAQRHAGSSSRRLQRPQAIEDHVHRFHRATLRTGTTIRPGTFALRSLRYIHGPGWHRW